MGATAHHSHPRNRHNVDMDMPMRSPIPDWLTPVAWAYLALSLLSAACVAADIYWGRRRHENVATQLVWITSALYLGPFAIPLYLGRGRTHGASTPAAGTVASADDTVRALLPGGAASAVAHLVAVPFVIAAGWTIAGLAMWPMIIVIAALAVAMLTVYGLAADHSDHRRVSIGAAIAAAVITVAAFDIGMVGWMLLLHYNNAMPPASESTFWFLMQMGVIVGLLTGYPAVKWLMSRDQDGVPA